MNPRVSAVLLAWVQLALAGRAWHFTDVHVDPIYVVNSSVFGYCNGAITSNATDQAPVFGAPVGDCATPRALYNSAVEFMASQEHANFVLFTGDFTQAGLTSESAVLGTIAQATQSLKAALPGAKIFGTVGNHDAYPGDVFQYPFPTAYANFAELWTLDDDAKATVLQGGHYSMRAADNLQIVSINTNYLATLNPLVKNTTGSEYKFGFEMMDWFAGELQKAADSNISVWILGHIPGELWLPEHTLRYQQLVQGHASTIKGQFYGHDHEDYVRLTRECPSKNCTGAPTGVVWVGPSLTEGWPSENPAIRLYEFDDASSGILDALTYSTNLTQANKVGSVAWELEYSTRLRFGMEDLSPQAWARQIEEQVAKNETAFREHVALRRRLYDGPRSRSSGEPCTSLDEACAKAMLCKIMHFDDEQVAACVAA
eukprot:TRINITY_DN19606_c0_g2_i1.p1 TRINITY_DN19606_c0_g2~~TRINITY_DN19606_c0_g2_i1.p1  ORF type:complete len:428 (-),score=86.94 TRINITY_DN19606_c0_g2_i1:39-1322(-)